MCATLLLLRLKFLWKLGFLLPSLSSPSWRSFPHLANFLGFGYVCSKQNPLYVLQGLPINVCICAMGRKLYVRVLHFGT